MADVAWPYLLHILEWESNAERGQLSSSENRYFQKRKAVHSGLCQRLIEAAKIGKAGTAELRGCDGLSRIIRIDPSHPRKSAVPAVQISPAPI